MRLLTTTALAVVLGFTVGGCDGDTVEVTGIGVSLGLPSSTMTGSDEVGVGNVHWVGNPRW